MILPQQIARSQLHHTQYRNELELTPNSCCPICYLVQEIPVTFLSFWNWLQNIVPSAYHYNNNTIAAFQVAE